DPAWVTQAIAERVAEVLGDWAAVILKAPDSNELRVASIYHRDMASLGLAWSYIYRQPLVVGEGIIGQVVATGYPSLTQNVGGSGLKDESLSIASHELRTPVTSIKGYTQLAKTLIRENDLATSEEYLDIALDQIDRMSRLILELLDVSRIETGRLEIRREPI